MKTAYTIFFILLIHLCTNAQNKDITIDSEGKIIPDTPSDEGNLPRNVEDVLTYFYANITDAKKVDEIISFRFYQKTPYMKFKELLSQINKTTGKIINKVVVKEEYSKDKRSVMLTLKITYEKIVTNEILVLIQETADGRYEVYEYQIKK